MTPISSAFTVQRESDLCCCHLRGLGLLTESRRELASRLASCPHLPFLPAFSTHAETSCLHVSQVTSLPFSEASKSSCSALEKSRSSFWAACRGKLLSPPSLRTAALLFPSNVGASGHGPPASCPLCCSLLPRDWLPHFFMLFFKLRKQIMKT